MINIKNILILLFLSLTCIIAMEQDISTSQQIKEYIKRTITNKYKALCLVEQMLNWDTQRCAKAMIQNIQAKQRILNEKLSILQQPPIETGKSLIAIIEFKPEDINDPKIVDLIGQVCNELGLGQALEEFNLHLEQNQAAPGLFLNELISHTDVVRVTSEKSLH